jgi:hypothetical protein
MFVVIACLLVGVLGSQPLAAQGEPQKDLSLRLADAVVHLVAHISADASGIRLTEESV